MTMNDSRDRVIYIAGYGRSGSTILDILLSQADDTVGVGELATMCRHVWDRDEYCACGNPIRSCDVWPKVMENWGVDHDAHHDLQRRIEPMFSRTRRRGGDALSRYLEETRALYESIRAAFNAKMIVDSSKMPGRAAAILSDTSMDSAVIHLVRDPRSVISSMSRPIAKNVAAGVQKDIRGKSAVRTAIRWSLYNAAIERLRGTVPPERFIRIRYEDLVSDTQAQLARIEDRFDIDLSDSMRVLKNGRTLDIGHQMAGSRIRMNDTMVLASENSPLAPPGSAEERLAWGIVAPFVRRYGYPRNV